MGEQELISALRQIKDLAESALAGVGSRRRRSPKKVIAAKGNRIESLPNRIIRMRDEGFFRQPKSAEDVHEKLQTTYACDINRVAVALLRLQRKKQLRKTERAGGKKKGVAFVW